MRYLTVHYKVDWNERVNEVETSEKTCMTSGSSACLASWLTNVGDKSDVERAVNHLLETVTQKHTIRLFSFCKRNVLFKNIMLPQSQPVHRVSQYTNGFCGWLETGSGKQAIQKISLIYQLFKKPLISVCSKLWSVNGLWISRHTSNGCGCCLTSNTASRNCSLERIVYHIRRLKLLRARIYSILIWALLHKYVMQILCLLTLINYVFAVYIS